jgi:hypothetical protein
MSTCSFSMSLRSSLKREVVPAFPFGVVISEKCRRRLESRDDAMAVFNNEGGTNGGVDLDVDEVILIAVCTSNLPCIQPLCQCFRMSHLGGPENTPKFADFRESRAVQRQSPDNSYLYNFKSSNLSL